MPKRFATTPLQTLLLLVATATSTQAASGPVKYLKNSADWFGGD